MLERIISGRAPDVKRLSYQQKIFQIRRSRRRREQVRNQKRRQGRYRSKFFKPKELMFAPRYFNLIRGDGIDVVKFIRAIGSAVLKQGISVRLNFRYTETFAVPATILLFAEIDRVIALSPLSKPITLIPPFRRRPREVMKQIGLFNLSQDRSDVVPERADVVYWKATKGESQTGDDYGSLVEVLAEKANKDHARHIEVSGLWRGVNEAIANSVDHAYKHPRTDGFAGEIPTKWWMFSQIRDGVFTLAVCDLGCGYRATINETIPEQFISAIRASFGQGNRDAFAIATAMEYGRSGTHLTHRGRGSRDVLSLLVKHRHGTLVILSNTGWMKYECNDGVVEAPSQGDLGIDIGGTIVWWKLPLEE